MNDADWPQFASMAQVDTIFPTYDDHVILASVEDLFERVTAASARLSTSTLARGREVVERRLGLRGPAMTLEEVGRCLGVTRERVRQIEKRERSIIGAQRGWFDSGVANQLVCALTDRGSLFILQPEELDPLLKAFIGLVNIGQPRIGVAVAADAITICVRPWDAALVSRSLVPAIRAFWNGGLTEALSLLKAIVPESLSTRSRESAEEYFSNWLAGIERNRSGLIRRADLCWRALLELGNTSHFTDVARVTARMEGVETTPRYVHNIHAVLGRNTDVFVRPGGNGMFALLSQAEDPRGRGLKDLMAEALLTTNLWLSAEQVLTLLPRGSRYKLPSILLTATMFPETFAVAEIFGLIQLAGRTDLHAPQSDRDEVEDVLRARKNGTRKTLYAALPHLAPSSIDAALFCNPCVVGIGSFKYLRFVLFSRPVSGKVLSTAEFADLISQQTGLLSAPALASYIERQYGWNPGMENIGG